MKSRPAFWPALLLGLVIVVPPAHAANLLVNGGFESPAGVNPYQIFGSGFSAMPGWTVESGTVEITAATYWQAAEGAQSLDLNGIFESIGTIYQDFATVPGQDYRIRFAYAGNPECELPALKTANTFWNGQLLTNLTFDITGYSNTNVGWTYYEQTVTASSSNSRVRFQATSPTFCGLILDDVSVVAIFPSNSCVVAAPNLISWWAAEGNAADRSGQTVGTTPFGIEYASGVAGQAFNFTGNRRVSLPDADALKLTNSLTVEAWIFIRNYGGFLLFRGDNRPGLDPYALMVDGQGRLQFHIESLDAAVNLLTPVALHTWHHVAATLDGESGDMRLFINGELVAQANTTIRPFRDLDARSGPAIGIGNHGGTVHNFPFDGLIDELAIYDRALTAGEIQALHAAGSAGKCGPAPAATVPVISSFQPPSANPGSIVTLTGTNFSPVAASNIVFFGAVRATVTSASMGSLTVTVPPGATYAPITLSVAGLVAYANQPFQPTFPGDSSKDISPASFAPRFDLAGGDGAHRSAIADLDGDGKPDIVVADVYGHTLSLFRNLSSSGSLSNGSFAPRVVLPTEGGASDNPYGFVVADVDGDGKPDLVVCDRLGNHVSVYGNIATPGNLDTNSFAPRVNFSVGADPRYARVADLDGDGRPDIVTANYAANTISILRNIGDSGGFDGNFFAPAVNLPAGDGPYDVVLGDLDGDFRPDLAVVCNNGPTLSLYRNLAEPGALTADSFAARVDLEALSGNDTIAFGDIDGDGKPDLVFGSYLSGTLSVYRNQASPGPFTTGSFAPRVDFATGNWTHTVALSDLNGDGRTDIASVGELESYLSIFQNRSLPGSFTNGSLAARVDLGAGWNAWGLSIGDLDGDGRPDLVFCNAYDDTVSIYQNVVAFTNAPPPQTNDCVAPPAGLVSSWRMEGDGSDSASGNHGTLLNGASFTVGKVGQALSFDGINDHFRVADQPNLRLTNGLSVEAWIFPTSLGGNHCIMSKWDAVIGPDQRSFTVGLQPDGRAFLGLSPNGLEVGATVFSSNSVPLNQWTYLAVTYDGAALRMYLNGEFHDQMPYTQGIFPGTSDLGMGANVGGTAAGDVSSPFAALFAGTIDEPGIYSRALSANEIAAIYNAGSAGKCAVSNPPSSSPILAGPITNAANGHRYYLLDATNWPAAEAIAVNLGGHLVTINDAAENEWVFTTFGNFGGVERDLWIGLTDQAYEGSWQWISGNSSTYRNWSPIEPNNGGGFHPDEDHALIWHTSSGFPPGSWNDAPGHMLRCAVVEVGSAPPPATVVLTGPITNAANGHWYYLLDATNWPAAEEIAMSLGGHLTTINDAAENDWVFTTFGNFAGMERTLWIGLTDQTYEGHWQWISGASDSYLNWAPGEPNNGGGYFADEDHALIWHSSSGFPPGTWNDAPGNQPHHAVVEVRTPSDSPRTMMSISRSYEPVDGEFGVLFTGESGRTYFIEATFDWVTWETVGAAAYVGNGLFEFVDTNAWRYPSRFYRTTAP